MREKLKKLDEPIHNNKEAAVLAKLFRRINMDLNTTGKMEHLIDRYIKYANNKNISLLKKKTRSSLCNSIVSEEMSWRTFMDLVFNLLRVKRMKISITFLHADDTESFHSMKFDNGRNKDFERRSRRGRREDNKNDTE